MLNKTNKFRKQSCTLDSPCEAKNKLKKLSISKKPRKASFSSYELVQNAKP